MVSIRDDARAVSDLRGRRAFAAIAHRERPLPMHVLGLPRRQLSPDIDPLEMVDLAQHAPDRRQWAAAIDADLEHGLTSCGNADFSCFGGWKNAWLPSVTHYNH
jgi:hypothetical protein